MFSVLKVTEEDIPIISTIAHQTWPHTFKDILSPEQIAYMLKGMYSLESLLEQMREKKNVFCLAKDEEQFIGYVSYELNYERTSKTKIHKIYILPSVQGKGVGKLLMDTVAEQAIRNNNLALSLNVNRYNQAVGFYEKYGFVKVGKEDIDIGNGYLMEDFIMEKSLK